jgi:hypothetical protein
VWALLPIGHVHRNTHDCINIQDDDEDQRVKNKSARRLVPIYDSLIEAGLIRYVEKLRAAGADRLFPELKAGRDGFSATP